MVCRGPECLAGKPLERRRFQPFNWNYKELQAGAARRVMPPVVP